ncbi:MAG: ATP-binding protein [Saprospiraceae bacterium]
MLLLFCTNDIVAQFTELPVLSLPDTSLMISLTPEQIGFVEDSTATITLENLENQSFSPLVFRNTQQISQSGFNYWAALKIANPHDFANTYWLEVPGNDVQAWVENKNKQVSTFRTGNLLPQKEKAIQGLFRNFNYIPLHLAPHDTLTIKLHNQTGKFFPIYFGTYKLGKPIYFENWQHQRFGNTSFINGLFGALMIACCVYCLVYLLLTKEIFALGIILYCLSLLGYSLQFNSTWYRLGLNPVFIQVFCLVLINLSMVIHFFFIRSFLNLKEQFPRYDTLFKYCSYLLLAFTILNTIFYWFSENYLTTLLMIIIVHTIFYLPSIVAGFKLVRVRERGVQILAIGMLLSHLIWVYNNLQLFNLSNDLLKIGGMIYVLTILISLGFRAAEAQRQKIRSEAERLLDKVKLEEMQKLDGLKSIFFANISHELRTPLTLIMSPIRSVIKSGNLDNRNFTLLKKAEQSSEDLLKLTNSILDLTKLEAGKLELVNATTPLYSFLQRTVANFESLAQARQIRLVFDYQLSPTLTLELDEEKLSVVLNNLLSNACKYTPADGSIWVKITDKFPQIEIKIADTGTGIHPGDLPHIFNRFYQSKQANAPIQGGTGIGLALAREYVQLMGGTIDVVSEIGLGTTFTIQVPCREVLGVMPNTNNGPISTLSSEPTIPTASSLSNDHATILIVEDNHSMRNYLSMVLSDYYRVITAENGQDGWQQLQQSSPSIDLILSDIMMPIMDGYQLLEKIKSNTDLRHLPCLMLTARADLQDKLKALRIGVDDYLLKPFVEEELLVRIDNLLQNRANRVIESTTEESQKTATIKFSEEEQTWLFQFENTLQQQINNPNYSINDMVADFSISESTLSRQLKKLTGLTPARYLREIRLNEARRLLESRKFKNVTQVAYAVGFADNATFSRNYKKRFGKTPTEALQV